LAAAQAEAAAKGGDGPPLAEAPSKAKAKAKLANKKNKSASKKAAAKALPKVSASKKPEAPTATTRNQAGSQAYRAALKAAKDKGKTSDQALVLAKAAYRSASAQF
jgi:hypothetical protein